MAVERIHLDKRVKILWFLPNTLVLLFLLLVALIAFTAIPDASLLGVTRANFFYVLPVAVVALGALVYSWLDLIYRNFTYELDNREIIIRQGVVTRRTTVIPYAAIQDITSERSLGERMLGLATLEIETAGSAHLASEIVLPGISNKDAVIHEVMQRVEKAKGTMGTEARSQGTDVSQLLSSILDELKLISSKLEALGKKNNEKAASKEDKADSSYGSYVQFRRK